MPLLSNPGLLGGAPRTLSKQERHVASRSASHRGKGHAANPTIAVREKCREKITASAPAYSWPHPGQSEASLPWRGRRRVAGHDGFSAVMIYLYISMMPWKLIKSYCM